MIFIDFTSRRLGKNFFKFLAISSMVIERKWTIFGSFLVDFLEESSGDGQNGQKWPFFSVEKSSILEAKW